MRRTNTCQWWQWNTGSTSSSNKRRTHKLPCRIPWQVKPCMELVIDKPITTCNLPHDEHFLIRNALSLGPYLYLQEPWHHLTVLPPLITMAQIASRDWYKWPLPYTDHHVPKALLIFSKTLTPHYCAHVAHNHGPNYKLWLADKWPFLYTKHLGPRALPISSRITTLYYRAPNAHNHGPYYKP